LDVQTSSDLSNNPERARQFREMLLQDIDDELQCLKAAFENDDRDALGLAAHTLKGLCGYLTDREPVKLAAWLQQNAQSARREQLRPVIEQLRALCQNGHDREPMEESL
jgi:HPt (histidine-containing phosphotransfer) domain-containing protein